MRNHFIAGLLLGISACIATGNTKQEAVVVPVPTAELPGGYQSCGSYKSSLSRLLARDNFQCERDSADFEARIGAQTGYPVDTSRRAQFWRACKAHDLCYWTPGKTKVQCDRAFHNDLIRECDAAFADHEVRGSCRRSCITDAHVYVHFVSTSGLAEQSFTEAQSAAAAVVSALADLPNGRDSSVVDPDLAVLVGQGCYWNNAGKCLVPEAVDWVRQRRSAAAKTADLE